MTSTVPLDPTYSSTVNLVQPDGSILTAINVDMLTTDEELQAGYQDVSVPPRLDVQGLLFDFSNEEEDVKTFHMRNVYFDLDLLCFNREGYIVKIIRGMKSPYTLDENLERVVSVNRTLYNKVYSSQVPCTYCIEVLAGWNSFGVTRNTKLQ